MLKKIDKLLTLSGDIGMIGISATIVYVGACMIKGAFNELKKDFKK